MQQEYFKISTLADIEAIEKTPIHQRIPAESTYGLLEHSAANDPDAPALSFIANGDQYSQAQQVNYQQLLGKVRQCANLFHALGVGPEDVVTYLLPNLLETHYVLWGAEAVGVANPINPMLEANTIRDICRAAGTKVLVALGPMANSDIWQKALAIQDQLPSLQHLLCVGPGETSAATPNLSIALADYPKDHLQFERTIEGQDLASLYHTGGTTGTPKLARHSHLNEVAMAWMIAAAGHIHRDSTMLCGLPMFHVNATTVTGIAPFLMNAHVVLLGPAGYRDPSIIKNFYAIVEHFKASYFSAVPTVLSALLTNDPSKNDCTSLEYTICGAAPLGTELFRRFERQSGVKILEGYGLTEGTCASAINPRAGTRKIGSIGLRLPYQEMKVVIVDSQDHYLRDAKSDEIGIIAIRGPNIFTGYVEENHNLGIWLQEGWFNTGDLGRQDKDGYFWLTGRKKELIIRGGHNLDPAQIEEVFYQLPQVAVAAAVGCPDAHAGEVPVVFVQLAKDSVYTASYLLEYASTRIGERAAIPKEVHIIDSMPLTAVGKLFKPALRWDLIQRTFRRALKDLSASFQSLKVQAGEDPAWGTMVKLYVVPMEGQSAAQLSAQIKDKLAAYACHYEIIMKAE